MKKQQRHLFKIALVAVVLACFGSVSADEYYAGGVTVDIDDDVLGYLWVEDATVNLFENAHIVNDEFFGDIYATSGAVINIYGGAIDGIIFVTTASNEFTEAEVTVYGTDFAIDGVPVDPATTEVFLQEQELSGVYESGTDFAYMVDCVVDGDFYLTVKLGWIAEEPLTPAEQMELIFTYYELGLEDGSIEAVQYGHGHKRFHRRGYGYNKRCFGKFKRDPFEKMLTIADRLIDSEYDHYAVRVLTMIEKKCDGERRPRDIITGDGVPVLNEMINTLIDTLTVEQN